MALESGNPMLAQAALDSAKQSQVECRGYEAAEPLSAQIVVPVDAGRKLMQHEFYETEGNARATIE